MLAKFGRRSYKLARRIAIAVIGGTTVVVGIIMIVTPGPAFLVIPMGLAILALEFAWARQWLNQVKERLNGEQLKNLLQRSRRTRDHPQPQQHEEDC